MYLVNLIKYFIVDIVVYTYSCICDSNIVSYHKFKDETTRTSIYVKGYPTISARTFTYTRHCIMQIDGTQEM